MKLIAKTKKTKTSKSYLFLFALLFFATAEAATQASIDDTWNKGLAWLIQTQNGNGSWANIQGTEFIATTAAIDTLGRANVINFNYNKGLSWISNNKPHSVDSLARKIMTTYNSHGVVTYGLKQTNNLISTP